MPAYGHYYFLTHGTGGETISYYDVAISWTMSQRGWSCASNLLYLFITLTMLWLDLFYEGQLAKSVWSVSIRLKFLKVSLSSLRTFTYIQRWKCFSAATIAEVKRAQKMPGIQQRSIASEIWRKAETFLCSLIVTIKWQSSAEEAQEPGFFWLLVSSNVSLTHVFPSYSVTFIWLFHLRHLLVFYFTVWGVLCCPKRKSPPVFEVFDAHFCLVVVNNLLWLQARCYICWLWCFRFAFSSGNFPWTSSARIALCTFSYPNGSESLQLGVCQIIIKKFCFRHIALSVSVIFSFSLPPRLMAIFVVSNFSLMDGFWQIYWFGGFPPSGEDLNSQPLLLWPNRLHSFLLFCLF